MKISIFFFMDFNSAFRYSFKGILISNNTYIHTYITGARTMMIHVGGNGEWIEFEYKFEE